MGRDGAGWGRQREMQTKTRSERWAGTLALCIKVMFIKALDFCFVLLFFLHLCDWIQKSIIPFLYIFHAFMLYSSINQIFFSRLHFIIVNKNRLAFRFPIPKKKKMLCSYFHYNY